MTESIILCLISLFSAIGIISAVKVFTAQLLNRHKQSPYIVIGVKNHQDSIEGIARLLMRTHPSSEILIIDYGSSDETRAIIDKLCGDFPKIQKKFN